MLSRAWAREARKIGSTVLQTTREEIRFSGFGARCCWLAHRNRGKPAFQRFHHLAVAAALKRFQEQRAGWLQMAASEVDSQLSQVGITGGIRRRDSREVRRH